MKKTITFSTLFFCPLFLMGQVIFKNFPSLDALLKQAKKENKLVFIQIESASCGQCNDVAMKGLSGIELKEKYAFNFVSTKVATNDALYPSVMEKFGIKNGMGSLYLDSKGNVLLKMNSTTSFTYTYLQWADKAIGNIDKVGDTQALEDAYNTGNRSPIFLEKYIISLRELDKNSDAIMEEFIQKMTVDSLKSDRIIKFVKEQGLSLNSPAYKAIHALNDYKKTDSIWFSLPLSQRVAINNRIITATLEEAIKKKDRNLANRASQFTRNTHNDYKKGQYAAQKNMIYFSKSIHDTAACLEQMTFLANMIMYQKIDSLKVLDTKEREEAFARREKDIRFVTPSALYATDLNNIAWDFYQMTDDSTKLVKALKWSDYSIAIARELANLPNGENGGFMDTYAHLLYKLKQYDAAIEWQTKAINAQKATGVTTERFEAERDKMKNRKL